MSSNINDLKQIIDTTIICEYWKDNFIDYNSRLINTNKFIDDKQLLTILVFKTLLN